MPVKRVVCLANSRKLVERCVAGREWIEGRGAGDWVRLVSDRETQGVSAVRAAVRGRQRPAGSGHHRYPVVGTSATGPPDRELAARSRVLLGKSGPAVVLRSAGAPRSRRSPLDRRIQHLQRPERHDPDRGNRLSLRFIATDSGRSIGTCRMLARRGIREQQAAGAGSIPFRWFDLRALGHRSEIRKNVLGEVGRHLSTRRVLSHDQP